MSVWEEKISSLEGLVKTSQADMEAQRGPSLITIEDDPVLTPAPAPTPESDPLPSSSESQIEMRSEWKN